MALGHRGDRRVRPVWTSRLSVAHYGEQNGDLMRDPEMCFEFGLAGGAHLNPSIGATTTQGLSSGAASFEKTTTAITRSFTSNTNASPRRGTTTCACRASPKPSRTSAFAASPLPWSGTARQCAALRPPSLNRSKGAHHHEHPSHQCHRVPQPSSCRAHRVHHQPPPHFEENALKELAETIRSQGVLSPLLVRPT
jgi:hypothetical protein